MSSRRPRSVRGSARKVCGEKKRKVTKQDVLHGPSGWASPILPQFKTNFPSSEPFITFNSSHHGSYLNKMDCGLDTKLTLCSTPATTSLHSLVSPPANNSSSLFSELSLTQEAQQPSFVVSPFVSLDGSTSISQTPHAASLLHLSHWGLPDEVLERYSNRGVVTMFEWQAECLSQPGVLGGRNLIYSAPTSGGKTLVAELLAMKCVLELQKKVILILPFVSIVQEKTNYLKDLLLPVGIKVSGFMGNQSPHGGFAAADIAICTIERANSLVNHLLEEGRSGELGAVIVDEMHMIGDHHRGYLLELLLTKLLYVYRKIQQSSEASQENMSKVQIVGMSATLPNLPILATWLKAALYQTDFRPVPLKEMVKVGPILYSSDFEQIREYGGSKGDEEDILRICSERVVEGHSVVIFCPTKSWCEKLAITISSASFLSSKDHQANCPSVELNNEVLASVCNELWKTPAGLDATLKKTVPSGVAFHHAGLTYEEREIIERAFRQHHIKILVATSTLSSGVNLPAHLVVIRTPIFQRSLLGIMEYKQMVGRAGRKGMDTHGESILICKPSEKGKVTALLKSTPQPVRSCLGRSPPTNTTGLARDSSKRSSDHLLSLNRAVLEVIASGTASTRNDVVMYISCTLLFAELEDSFKQSHGNNPTSSVATLTEETLVYLADNEFIATRNAGKQLCPSTEQQLKSGEGETNKENIEQEYYATQLGLATMASALSPSEALVVFAEFARARKAFVLENELHLIYLVTPVYIQEQWPSIDWYRFLQIWERLSTDMMHVGTVIGIQESFLVQACQGRIPERTITQRQKLQTHRRFLTALVLHDLVQEVPIPAVAQKYNVSKGLLQNLQISSGTFAGMVTVFCNRLGWKNLELLLNQFQSRLIFGIERELCDLVQISALSGNHARLLYNAGFHTLTSLAMANPNAIESCLRKAFPFYSLKGDGGDKKWTIWCSRLRKALTDTELTELIITEAQTILSEQLGLPDSAWKKYTDLKGKNLFHERGNDQFLAPAVLPNTATKMGIHKTVRKREIQTASPCIVDKREDVENVELLPAVPLSEVAVEEKINNLELQSQAASKLLRLNLSSPPTNTCMRSPDIDLSSPFLLASNNTPCSVINRRNSSTSMTNPLSSSRFDETSELSKSLISTQALAVIDAACIEAMQEEEHLDPPQGLIRMDAKDSVDMHIDNQATNPFPAQELKDLENLHVCSPDNSSLKVIDVSSNKQLFDNFISIACEQSFITFSFATEPTKIGGIGLSKGNQKTNLKGIPLVQSNDQIIGIAVCFGGIKVYYLSLSDGVYGSKEKMSPSRFGQKSAVPLSSQLNGLAQILADTRQVNLTAYDLKGQAKLMMAAIGSDLCPKSVTCDPIVADWLLESSNKSKTLHQMVTQYLPSQPLLEQGSKDLSNILCTMATNSPFPHFRAAAEVVLANLLMDKFIPLLKEKELYTSFSSVEMPSQILLAKIEFNGIGICSEVCSQLQDTLKDHLSQLEQLAYEYAGRQFLLSSPDEVAQVLFIELELPSEQEPCADIRANTRQTRKRRVQHLSTSKDVLAKICHLHPLPSVILEWRRVFHTLTVMLFPLLKEMVHHQENGTCDRVYSTCQLHSATGRVSFTQPNIQNIPKEYTIGLQNRVLHNQQQSLSFCASNADVSREIVEKAFVVQTVCLRDAFCASSETLFLAADYSQLELRIMAHLSGDSRLQTYLNSDGDAFRLIAGEWLGVLPAEVSDDQRQQTKQLCYGMIYGIGGKALAEQLSVTESEAISFVESFKSKFPEMQKFIADTKQQCLAKGYITTLTGRRRYLPDIHHTNIQLRNQAERQAINSTIQGSAADLVKIAMKNIDYQLKQAKFSTIFSENSSKSVLLVLQLHDELMYEVHESLLAEVALVVKKEMEHALQLMVTTPVKLKTGKLWGSLIPYAP